MRTPSYAITPEQAQSARVGVPLVLMPTVGRWRRFLAWLRLVRLPPPMSLDVVSTDGGALTLEASPGQQFSVHGVSDGKP